MPAPDARTLSDEQLTQIIDQAKQANEVDGHEFAECPRSTVDDCRYCEAQLSLTPPVGQAMAEEILRLRAAQPTREAVEKVVNDVGGAFHCNDCRHAFKIRFLDALQSAGLLRASAGTTEEGQ